MSRNYIPSLYIFKVSFYIPSLPYQSCNGRMRFFPDSSWQERRQQQQRHTPRIPNKEKHYALKLLEIGRSPWFGHWPPCHSAVISIINCRCYVVSLPLVLRSMFVVVAVLFSYIISLFVYVYAFSSSVVHSAAVPASNYVFLNWIRAE